MKTSRRKLRNEATQLEVDIIDEWLDKNGDPAIAKLVEKNLAIANKISALLKLKEMRPADLAKKMGKQRSEITKWLSGQNNFTTKTITKIETILGEEIIHIKPPVTNVYWTVTINPSSEKVTTEGFEDSTVDETKMAIGC